MGKKVNKCVEITSSADAISVDGLLQNSLQRNNSVWSADKWMYNVFELQPISKMQKLCL